MFTNEQIAHDIAIARMAGKQLSAPILVEEYRNCYKNVLEYLNSEAKAPSAAETKAMPRFF